MNKLPKTEESKALEEHLFIATSLKIGLTIQDLKELEYKDVVKIMLCFVQENKTKSVNTATQKDWDKLARM